MNNNNILTLSCKWYINVLYPFNCNFPDEN